MPLQQSDLKVTGVVPDTLQGAGGAPIEAVRVYYFIGEHGPYSVVIPKLEMSAQRVLTDIRKDAQQYIDILNLTF